MPEDYPLKPPRLRITEGQNLEKGFVHEHVFGNSANGYRVCTDILYDFSNYFSWIGFN